MTNLRVSVNSSGTLITKDDLPVRTIMGSSGITVLNDSHDMVVSLTRAITAGNGITVTNSSNATEIALEQQSELTAQLTTLTHTEPETPDYAIQGMTLLTPYGFKTSDEGNTVLKVIANLQVRVAELEARLQSAGLL